MAKNARLIGTGVATGELVIENDRFARVMETDDAWIRERTGIERRCFVTPGVASSDLGVAAARSALDDAGIAADAIDYVVCATMTPDHYFPGSATPIQHGLGISPRPCLDIRQQCAGFAYGMQVSDALIRAGAAETVLLVGADVHTSLMPFSEATWKRLLADDDGRLTDGDDLAWNTRFRHLTVLFGDAAGAMVFRAGDADSGRGVLAAELYGDGANIEILHVPGLGSRSRPIVDEPMLRDGRWVPVMDGRNVFKLAVTRMPEVTRSVLAGQGLGLEDLDLLVMHQANLRINEAAQKAMGLADEKVHNNIQRYGNTTSATLPLCFHEAREQGRVGEGDLVAFTALGAGMHWGSVLMRV
ncbi:MAG: 3-oxoacyl-[acyl-carrier-protein] synthase III C-terminal domain-containing protein [Thermoanaerobaculia bacterium]|nr:3-oxoacyl-[acyl-carrier-protein] synthase III C-terminal domain-containing protein [Thermoanaerobaculia bacterium]